MVRIQSSLLLFFSLFMVCPVGQAKEEPLANNLLAVVNGEEISTEEYLIELSKGMRQRFYHGNVAAEKVAKFRQEIADRMVDDLLLLQEARSRGIKADSSAIEGQLLQYERRYAGSEQWESRREKLLPALRKQLEDQSILALVKQELKRVTDVEPGAVRQYYEQHPENFTSPERHRISLILLKVDPSSPRGVWDQARSEAAELVDKIKGGSPLLS